MKKKIYAGLRVWALMPSFLTYRMLPWRY